MFVFRRGCDLALASAERKICSKQESGRGVYGGMSCLSSYWERGYGMSPLYLRQIDGEWMSRSLRCECTIMNVGAGVERNREVDR
jgi:hypothetical protein